MTMSIFSESTLARFAREVAKYPADQKQSAVMACLAITQQELGFVSPDSEAAIGAYLGMPVIAVHEVTTFYNMYNQAPVGKFKLNVCTNLPCQLGAHGGGQKALDYVCGKLGVQPYGTTADGVFTVDGDMRITWFNQAAERIFGFSRDEAIGQGRQQQCGDDGRKNDDDPAHRRGAALRLVARRPLCSNDLPHLQCLQFPDDDGAEHEGDAERHDHRRRGAEGDVGDEVEEQAGLPEWREQVVEHRPSVGGSGAWQDSRKDTLKGDPTRTLQKDELIAAEACRQHRTHRLRIGCLKKAARVALPEGGEGGHLAQLVGGALGRDEGRRLRHGPAISLGRGRGRPAATPAT